MTPVVQKTRLTPLAFLILAVWQFTGVLTTLNESFLAAYLAGIPVILVFLAADFWSLPGKHRVRLTCQTEPRVDLDSTVVVHWLIEVAGQLWWPIRGFRWYEPGTPHLAFAQQAVAISRQQKRKGRPEFDFQISAKATQLGVVKELNPELAINSWWGFWRRHASTPVKLNLRITPYTEPVPPQDFEKVVSRQRLLFTGARQLIRGINNDQFHSVRKYQYPDSIRHIDQKKSARYQTLMTRIYDSYHNHHLIIGCDLGRSMMGDIGNSRKKDFYLSAALHLAENAVSAKDMVSFFAFHQTVTMTLPKSHRIEHFALLDPNSEALQVKPIESNYEILTQSVNSISKQRSIVVILCDLTRPSVQESLISSIGHLCRKHLVVLMSVVDKEVTVEDKLRTLSSSKLTDEQYSDLLYGYWLEDSFQLFEQRVAQLGGGVITAPERHWLDMTTKMYHLLRTSLRL